MGNLIESDLMFISGAVGGLEEDFRPGMVELVQRIGESGRAKMVCREGQRNNINVTETVGAAIPVDTDMHVWMFTTGDIFVTEPLSDEVKIRYRRTMRVSSAPFVYKTARSVEMPTVASIINILERQEDSSRLRIILRNNKPENSEAIAEFVEYAMSRLNEDHPEQDLVVFEDDDVRSETVMKAIESLGEKLPDTKASHDRTFKDATAVHELTRVDGES